MTPAATFFQRSTPSTSARSTAESWSRLCSTEDGNRSVAGRCCESIETRSLGGGRAALPPLPGDWSEPVRVRSVEPCASAGAGVSGSTTAGVEIARLPVSRGALRSVYLIPAPEPIDVGGRSVKRDFHPPLRGER
jgi:hypothetical protein